jgi:hypothetical protein
MIRTPRSTLFPFKHRAGAAPNNYEVTYPKGGPHNPYAHTGNAVDLKYILNIPSTAAGASSDFSTIPAYAGQTFTFGGLNWLVLAEHVSTSLDYAEDVNHYPFRAFLVRDAWIMVGPQDLPVGGFVTTGWEDATVYLRAFNISKTEHHTGGMFATSTRLKAAGGDTADFFVRCNEVPRGKLCVSDLYPILAIAIENIDASSFPAGRIAVYLDGLEGLWTAPSSTWFSASSPPWHCFS